MGIVDILFDLIVIFSIGTNPTSFIYMFAFRFIFSSIAGLFMLSGSGNLELISVIFNLLGIILGVILLFSPLTSIVFTSTMIIIAFILVGTIYVVDVLA